MDKGMKLVAGLSLAIVALIGGGLVFGNALEAQDAAPVQLAAEDVLAGEPALAEPPAEDIAFVESETVQDVPAYNPEDPFVIRRVLPIEGPIRYGEWYWDDEGVPDGPLVITVDLQARVLSVFRGGYEIGAAAVLIGSPSHPTPTGVFPILTKERHNVSEQYDNAPMPWTMRLTWDGVAIHGGRQVERGYASHGCIGTPDEFVSRIYDIARVGDIVIITDGVTTGVGGSLNHQG